MIEEKIYSKLKETIANAGGRFILLERLFSDAEALSPDMPSHLQSPEGQAAFHSAVMELVSGKILSPVGRKPGTFGGLYRKYRILDVRETKDDALVAKIIRNIAYPASLDYYIKNPQDFLTDRTAIEAISDFLKKGYKDLVTVNERAYELFGDEKFFKGGEKSRSRGETALKRLGLDYSSIGCIETPEPFFSFQKKDFFQKESRNIYIIENKDTFWSFKKQTMDSPSKLEADMLIYGEGKKIISSFRFVDEYDIDPGSDTFIYFGDLDPEGVNIYCELREQYTRYKIVPFFEGYKAILKIGLERVGGPAKTPRHQRVSRENIDGFLTGFDDTAGMKIKKLLTDGCYIPQEALSATKLKEMFGA